VNYEEEDAYVCTSCGAIVDNPEDMKRHEHRETKQR
jgi:DNA-directed RNA polymerase subunit RPC12/RpoP